jgi:hypothetical protein
MSKREVFYDANMVKWVIETVHDPACGASDYNGNYVWIHVDGDNEQYSGAIGETFGDAWAEFREGGYLEEDEPA